MQHTSNPIKFDIVLGSKQLLAIAGTNVQTKANASPFVVPKDS